MDGRDATEHYILLVDDDPKDIILGELTLRSAAVSNTIIVARSGEEAIRTLKDLGEPELVLLDLKMPGMSGVDVLKYINDSDDLCDTPVIVVTGSATPDDKNRLYEMGQTAIISKNFSYIDLLRVLIALEFQQTLLGPRSRS